MGDKRTEFPLSIVLRTIDRATPGLKRFNDQLDKTFKPYKDLNKEIGRLSENLGLGRIGSSLAGVGREVKKLGVQIGAVGLAAGAIGVHLFKGWVDEGDKLAKTADRLGLTIDGLAQLRYAGGQAGVAVEEMDGALQKMSVGLGQARAKTGSLYSFLGRVSPVLLKQVLATKSNEEAFLLLADAMEKIKDPAKKAAFTQAVFGRAGQPLINMMQNGSGEIREMMERYHQLAGSQEDAARTSEKVGDAIDDIGKAFDGVKAAIVSGVGPVVRDLAERMSSWLADNRERIAEWARDFGEKLPGRIDALIAAIRGIYDAVKPVWDAIGGAKGALIAFAAVKLAPLGAEVGKLVLSLGQLVVKLNAALGASQAAGAAAGGAGAGAGMGGKARGVLGVLGPLAGIGAAAYAVSRPIASREQAKRDAWLNANPERRAFMEERFGSEGSRGSLQQMFGGLEMQIKRPDLLKDAPPGSAGIDAVYSGARGFLDRVRSQKSLLEGTGALLMRDAQKAKIEIEIKGAPPGTRATTDPSSTADVDVSTGYQMGLL